MAALQPGGEPEAAADARRALGADFSAHHFGQAARDHQAKAGTAVAPGGRGIDLLEGAEQARQHVGCDADAGILDFEAQVDAVAAFLDQSDAQTTTRPCSVNLSALLA
jgi:hypothetical protein